MNEHADHVRLPGFRTVLRLDLARVFPLAGTAALGGIAIALAFSGFGALVQALKPLAFVGVFIAASLVVGATLVGLAVFFYVGMVGREAPVTRTWPVEGLALFGGKFVSGVIALSVSVAGALAMMLFAIVFLLPQGAPTIGDLVTALERAIREYPVVVACGILWGVLGFLASLTYLYFAVLAGSKGFLGKLGIGGPVIVAVIMWAVVSQVVGVASILIPLSFNFDTWSVETVSVLGSIIEAVGAGGEAEVALVPLALPLLQALMMVALLAWCAWDCTKVRDIQ